MPYAENLSMFRHVLSEVIFKIQPCILK